MSSRGSVGRNQTPVGKPRRPRPRVASASRFPMAWAPGPGNSPTRALGGQTRCHQAHLQMGKLRPQAFSDQPEVTRAKTVTEKGLHLRTGPEAPLGPVTTPQYRGREDPRPPEGEGLGLRGGHGAMSRDPTAVLRRWKHGLPRGNRRLGGDPTWACREAGMPNPHQAGAHTHGSAHTRCPVVITEAGEATQSHGRPQGNRQPDSCCAPQLCRAALGREQTLEGSDLEAYKPLQRLCVHGRDKPTFLLARDS